jgi:hypothetical protein
MMILNGRPSRAAEMTLCASAAPIWFWTGFWRSVLVMKNLSARGQEVSMCGGVYVDGMGTAH